MTIAYDHWDRLFDADTLRSPERLTSFIHHDLREVTFTPNKNLTAVRPVVLDPTIRQDLVTAARRLVTLVARVCWARTADPVELARLTGQGVPQMPFINAAGSTHEVQYAAIMARPDALLRNGKPIFMESNIGSAPGCVITSHFLLRAYQQLFGLKRDLAPQDHFAEPFAGRAALYRDIAERLGREPAAAVLGSFEDMVSRRHLEAEVHYLRDHGIDSELVHPEDFRDGRIRFPVALKHLLPKEWARMGIDVNGVIRAHRDTVFLSPDSAQSLSSKIVFAWMSEGAPVMTEEDREFVREHIPWTRLLEPVEVEFEGAQANLVELVSANQDEFVLKPLNSFSGDGVLVGRTTEAQRWRAAVAAVAITRDHIVQRYVLADPLEMDFFDRTTGELVRHRVDYVLGPYVIDGVGAGCSLRHVPKTGPAGVVNHALGASLNVVY